MPSTGTCSGSPSSSSGTTPTAAALFGVADGSVIEGIEDSPDHPAEPPRGVTVAVEVADVDRLHRRVREVGVEIVEPPADRPWGHRTFEIRDSNSLLLVLSAVLPYAESAAERR